MKGLVFCCGLLIAALWCETQFSIVQSRLLNHVSNSLFYSLEVGGNDDIVYPRQGPFNVQRGYAHIPGFIHKLSMHGYEISEQMRFSPNLIKLSKWGIMPPYREPAIVGLTIRSQADVTLLNTTQTPKIYRNFDEIPPLVIDTLLVLEDRKLSIPRAQTSNPVVDWNRLSRAALLYGINRLGMTSRKEGGSTLATQLEKFRYSKQGITKTPIDKFKQIAGASLKVYSNGYNTYAARKNIIVDYLNAMPLSAAPGFGDVNGLGEGLYAWFGKDLTDANRSLNSPGQSAEQIIDFKQVLTLLTAIRAPSYYLRSDYNRLQSRVDFFTRVLENERVIDHRFASRLRKTKIKLTPLAAEKIEIDRDHRKAVNLTRNLLVDKLAISGYYELNNLNLEVNTTIDAVLQTAVMRLFEQLKDDHFLETNGFKKARLLASGSPSKVKYSFVLYEKTALGNELRALVDNEEGDFDINTGMKLDLGSTAKLRTLVHYLEIVHELYESYHDAPGQIQHSDPISRWVLIKMQKQPGMTIDELIAAALQKKYSASPDEKFFTGGGTHRFRNFNRKDNGRFISVREATVRSVNLVYIRLIRDIVKFHRERLNYNADALLRDDSPRRRLYLQQSADEEAKIYLSTFFRKYSTRTRGWIVENLLGNRRYSSRHLAILYFAWHREPNRNELAEWLLEYSREFNPDTLNRLWEAYNNPRLKLPDFGYLLNKHPLEVWTAEQMVNYPSMSLPAFLEESKSARRQTSAWLFNTQNRRARIDRLKTRIERDAFRRMTRYWRKCGYPFSNLVPSYATAIGTSADKPEALADLIGIILNKGVRKPKVLIKQLHFARKTPYHTVLRRQAQVSERILAEPVALALANVLEETVEKGTARRAYGAFRNRDGTGVSLGGKTGSGDNRIKTFDSEGNLIHSSPINRTATFVFTIGDRFFGVITAYVPGKAAGFYNFTSALPVSILKHLAKPMKQRLRING